MAKRAQSLGEDLLAVRDKQQAGPREVLGKPAVIHGGHHGLARARGCDQEIAVVALRTSQRDLGEQILLERFQANLNRAQHEGGAGTGSFGSLEKLFSLVRLKRAAVPVAVEDGRDLFHNVRIASPRHPHIPLQPCHLR